MAEPFSLATAIVELTKTGIALGKFLNDTWLSYRNAPAEVLEIAHEVTICCELMTPLGEQLKTGSVRYTSRFQEAVEGLVKNSNRTFSKVRDLVPSDGTLDRGIVPKWTYVLKKSKIEEHRKKLKEIQQMFLFMKQMMVEAQPSIHSHTIPGPGRTPSIGITTTKLGGTSQHFPLELSGQGIDETGQPVTYHATLVMKAASSSSTPRMSFQSPAYSSSHNIHSPTYPQSPMPKVDEERNKIVMEERQALKGKLAEKKGTSEQRPVSPSLRPPAYARSLRQNPYFSPELLETSESRSAIRKESKSEREDRSRYRSRKSSRSGTSEVQDGDSLHIPDDREAAEDVKELLISWFGPETDSTKSPRSPSISIVDTSLPSYQPTSPSPGNSVSPRHSPSPGGGSSRSGLASPRSPSSPGSYFASIDTRNVVAHRCDSCDKRIIGPRYECRSCHSYDLCQRCFNDPEVTIRLKHEHPKSHFESK